MTRAEIIEIFGIQQSAIDEVSSILGLPGLSTWRRNDLTKEIVERQGICSELLHALRMIDDRP